MMKKGKKWLAGLLALMLLAGTVLPSVAFGGTADNAGDAAYANSAGDDCLGSVAAADAARMQTAQDAPEYQAFLQNLKVLEGYAQTYAREHTGEDAVGLVINYVRCGVEKYTSGSWTMLAGEEKTDFTNYVASQDTANGTTAQALRSLKDTVRESR